jgi:hypothetical protein
MNLQVQVFAHDDEGENTKILENKKRFAFAVF